MGVAVRCGGTKHLGWNGNGSHDHIDSDSSSSINRTVSRTRTHGHYLIREVCDLMATITKKELIDHIAESTKTKHVVVKKIVQAFLDQIIVELGKGNRLEFRDFGVFEVKHRKSRMSQNPKTLEPVHITAKRTAKFKVGRLMRMALSEDEETAPETDTHVPV